MRTRERLERVGIPSDYAAIDGPNLFVQRDMIVDRFLRTDCTHLFLVDGDVGFSPDLCERLIAADLLVIGAALPQEAPSFRKLQAELSRRSFDEALALSCKWNVLVGRAPALRRGELCRVDALGPGCMVIQRACFLRLVESTELPLYRGHDGLEVKGFFRKSPDDKSASTHAFNFSEVWRMVGGEIWVLDTAPAWRLCDMRFGVRFSNYLDLLPRIGAPVLPGAEIRP
jgi:hypothetical protein